MGARALIKASWLGLVLATSPTFAAAQPATQKPAAPSLAPPTFASMPSADVLAAFYPQKAMIAKVEGHTALKCDVGPGGYLSRCVIVGEDPPGFGFGEAATGVAPYFRMRAPASGVLPTTFILGMKWVVPQDSNCNITCNVIDGQLRNCTYGDHAAPSPSEPLRRPATTFVGDCKAPKR